VAKLISTCAAMSAPPPARVLPSPRTGAPIPPGQLGIVNLTTDIEGMGAECGGAEPTPQTRFRDGSHGFVEQASSHHG
jgi:hypothetical protein